MNNVKIGVIGLGYVGLPLARLFSTKYEKVGFDMNQSRVDALNGGHDSTLEVSDAVVVKSGFSYDVQFLVKTNDRAVDLKVGAQQWSYGDLAKYWDPNDWSQIQAFFMFRKSVEPATLAAAKTAEGATVSFPGVDADDYVFFFEVLNEENTATQYAVRVTPDMFANAQ